MSRPSRVRAALIALLMAPMASVALAQTVNLSGAGATFPYPLYSKWFNEYNKLHPSIRVNYQSIGSGGGIRQFTQDRTVDFGASDGPMNDQQLRAAKVQPILHLPMTMGGVVPVYNLKVGGLRFSGETLANIFLGRIVMWNDTAIARENPGARLPVEPITVVHRADGSGTTYTWVDFLAKVSPEWKQRVGVGTSVTWPVGLGGKGNEGVAGTVKQTPGSIGYVELVYALQNRMTYAAVRNAAGEYTTCSLASVSAAATAQIPADYRVSITNAPGKGVYPISTFTWALVTPAMQDARKKQALHDFLLWALTKGQASAEGLGYAPLPKALIKRELKDLERLK